MIVIIEITDRIPIWQVGWHIGIFPICEHLAAALTAAVIL